MADTAVAATLNKIVWVASAFTPSILTTMTIMLILQLFDLLLQALVRLFYWLQIIIFTTQIIKALVDIVLVFYLLAPAAGVAGLTLKFHVLTFILKVVLKLMNVHIILVAI